MKLTIPLYIQGTPPRYLVRPLFTGLIESDWEAEGPLLQKVLSQAQNRCRQEIEAARKHERLDALAQLSFAPQLKEHFLELKLEYKKRTCKCKLLIVVLQALGQRLCFSPTLTDLWFPWPTDQQTLQQHASEALRVYLRARERAGMETTPEELSVGGKAWVH